MNTETPPETPPSTPPIQPAAAATSPTAAPVQVPVAATPPAAQPSDPRRRMRELMSIPERDRTDAQWDELNELEIQFAPGNRATAGPAGPVGAPRPFPQKNHPPKGGDRGDRGGKGGGGKGGGKGRPRPPQKQGPG